MLLVIAVCPIFILNITT